MGDVAQEGLVVLSALVDHIFLFLLLDFDLGRSLSVVLAILRELFLGSLCLNSRLFVVSESSI